MVGPEESARVGSYLMGQGEKYSFLELWPRLMTARLALIESLRDVSDEQADFQPAEGEWSIREVVHHVHNSTRSVVRTVERLARDEDPDPGERPDPPREPAVQSLDELRRGMLEDAVYLAGLPERVPDPPSLERTSNHPFFGDLHCRAWFLFQRVHDQDHTGQIEACKSASGYPDA